LPRSQHPVTAPPTLSPSGPRLGSPAIEVHGPRPTLQGRREAPSSFRHAAPDVRFLPPPPRSVHAVLQHTAHRRRSPPTFGFSRHGLNGPWEATTLPFSQPRPQRRPRPRRRVVDLVKLQAAMADRQEQPFEAVELDVIVPQSGRLKLGPLPDPGWPPLRRRAGHDPLGLPDRLGSIGSGPRPSKVSLQLIPPVDVRGAPARSSVWLAASLGGVAFRAAQVLVGAVWVSTGALTLGGGLACRSGRGS
jgi:hypothetical protein